MTADELDTAALRALLNEALDLAAEAILYAGEYFDDKWALSQRLAELRARAAGGVQPAPAAEQWCAGHNDGTAHPFSGHMTCHECGAVNWKACYHAVADSVQDDELSAGASTDGAGTPTADHIAIFDGPRRIQ